MSKHGWISSLTALFGILLAATTLLAQEVVKTKDGREVLLKPDGTWVYINEEQPKGAVSPAATPAAKNPGVVAPNSAGGGAASPNNLNTDKQKSTPQTPKPGNTDTGHTTPTGLEIYKGPRGGCYHYSKSGKKVYVPCS
jgi:hypothetical protein